MMDADDIVPIRLKALLKEPKNIDDQALAKKQAEEQDRDDLKTWKPRCRISFDLSVTSVAVAHEVVDPAKELANQW